MGSQSVLQLPPPSSTKLPGAEPWHRLLHPMSAAAVAQARPGVPLIAAEKTSALVEARALGHAVAQAAADLDELVRVRPWEAICTLSVAQLNWAALVPLKYAAVVDVHFSMCTLCRVNATGHNMGRSRSFLAVSKMSAVRSLLEPFVTLACPSRSTQNAHASLSRHGLGLCTAVCELPTCLGIYSGTGKPGVKQLGRR
jgi:hypothetical protein